MTDPITRSAAEVPGGAAGDAPRYGKARYARENARLNAVLDKRRPAMAVHRGSPGGSIVDNTVDAMRAASRQGADVIEIDVAKSTDGDFFCFHDGQEPRHFGIEENIHTLNTEQISALNYSHARVSGYGVTRLETMLEAVERYAPDCVLNIDRSWDHWPSLLRFLDTRCTPDRVLFKAPAGDEALALADHPVKYPFMPICRSVEDVERMLCLPDVNTVGVELVTHRPDSPFVTARYIAQVRERGVFVLVNALNLPNRVPVYAGMADEVSVLDDPERGWGAMIDLGADMIQTDWPMLLLDFMRRRNTG